MIFLNVSVIAWYSDKRHPPCSKCSVAVKFSHHQLTYTIWDILPWKCENQISWPCYTFLFRLYLKQRSYSDRFNFRSISIFLLILSCLLWMMLLGPPPTTFPAPTGPMEHVSGMSMGTLTLPPPWILSMTYSVSLNEKSEKLPFLQARVCTAPTLLFFFLFWAGNF